MTTPDDYTARVRAQLAALDAVLAHPATLRPEDPYDGPEPEPYYQGSDADYYANVGEEREQRWTA